MNTVAAIPEHLRRFAAVVTTDLDHLQAITGHLSTTLDRFQSRCREYSVPAVHGLTDELFTHYRSIGDLAAWVRTTADRLEAADQGVLYVMTLSNALTITAANSRQPMLSPHRLAWTAFDLGARMALRVIWELRSPTRWQPQLRRSLTTSGWFSRVIAPTLHLSRSWSVLTGTTIRHLFGAFGQQLHRQALVYYPSLLAWQHHWGTFAAIPYRYYIRDTIGHLEVITTLGLPPLHTIAWLTRFMPLPFSSLGHFAVPIADLGLVTNLPPSLSHLAEQIQRRASIVGQYQQLYTILPIVTSFAQHWQPLKWRLGPYSALATTQILSSPLLAMLASEQLDRLRPSLPVSNPVEVLAIFENDLWINAFENLPPDKIRELAIRLEQLNYAARMNLSLGPLTRPTTGPDAEPDGHVSATAVFPPLECNLDATQPYRITPAALQANAHSLISPYLGEEVRAARVGETEYVVGISGLNLDNMAYGTNGLVSVINTAEGKERVAENAYYQTVRSRMLDLIENLPEGSTLHLTGHSMGGGMCILLSNDPQVQTALAQRNIRLASVTTLGAVRPAGEWSDVPSSINAQAVTVRHYVDSDDALAKAVGAGHDDLRYRDNVYTLNNQTIDQPSVAHSAYETFDYTRLPNEVQTMPFTIDPMKFELLPIPTLSEPPAVEIEWPEAPPLSA